MQFACLLLAAGRSRRMQGPNKLLLNVGEMSLVRRTASEILKSSFSNRIAVTGYDGDSILSELQDLPFEIIHNPNHLSGMHSSIRAGLLALHDDVDAFFVCLGDQPYFHFSVLETMMNAFATLGNRKQICYPSYNGHRGQPVLIGADHISEILAHEDGDHGCQYLFQRYPNYVRAIEIADPRMGFDIDQPQDYQKYLESLSHG